MRTVFTVVGLILLSATAFGQVGGLDTTFGGDGKITTLVTFISAAHAVALQADGRIVTAGFGFNGTADEFAVARYNTDGSLDTTFGLEGIDTTRLRGGNSIATAVAIEPNGKIIVAGKSGDAVGATIEFALARYTTSGLLDSTFGTDGIDTFYVGSSDDEANGVAIQHDGKIVLAGFSNYAKSLTYSDFALLRVDSNGLLDTAFGNKGRVLTAIGPYNDRGYAMALQKDGKIVVTGSSNDGNHRNFVVVRYDTSGILDSLNFAFAKQGRDTIHFWQDNEFSYSILVQPNGKIVTGGTIALPGGNSIFALSRIYTDGTIDNTFGTNGRDTISFYGIDDAIKSMAIDSIGRIIAAGFTYNASTSDTNFAITRFDSTGAIDTTFIDSSGKVSLDIGTTNDEANGVVIQHDDKILMAGYAHNFAKEQFALVRFDITPDVISAIADIAMENKSLFVYPNPSGNNALLKYTLTTNGILSINIYDVTGRMVEPVIANKNLTMGSYEMPLNLDNLSAGFYILNLTNTNSQSLSIKFIKE